MIRLAVGTRFKVSATGDIYRVESFQATIAPLNSKDRDPAVWVNVVTLDGQKDSYDIKDIAESYRNGEIEAVE